MKRGIGLIAALTVLSATVFLLAGCEESTAISGTISIVNLDNTVGELYIMLDDDNKPENGVGTGKQLFIQLTSSETSIPYAMDTSDIPADTYYLFAGLNPTVDSNLSNWEALGWYGGTGADEGNPLPPDNANVSNLSTG